MVHAARDLKNVYAHVKRREQTRARTRGVRGFSLYRRTLVVADSMRLMVTYSKLPAIIPMMSSNTVNPNTMSEP